MPDDLCKNQLKLAQLAAGDRLEVLLTAGEPLQNVPKSATEQGFKVTDIRHVAGNIHQVTIEK